MNIAKQLYQLQEIDLEIEAKEQALGQKTALLGSRQALEQAQNRLDSARKHLDELKRQQHDAEGETEDLESKIKETEKQLYGGKIGNPKELANLQHEITTMKTRDDQLETKTLEILEQAEAAEKAAAAAIGDFKKLEGEWQQQQKLLAGDIERLQGRLAELRLERQQLSGEIDPQAFGLYEKIRQQKKPPVAKVEQGFCRVCRITLSASELQRVRGGNLIQCGSCGRILFLS